MHQCSAGLLLTGAAVMHRDMNVTYMKPRAPRGVSQQSVMEGVPLVPTPVVLIEYPARACRIESLCIFSVHVLLWSCMVASVPIDVVTCYS